MAIRLFWGEGCMEVSCVSDGYYPVTPPPDELREFTMWGNPAVFKRIGLVSGQGDYFYVGEYAMRIFKAEEKPIINYQPRLRPPPATGASGFSSLSSRHLRGS